MKPSLSMVLCNTLAGAGQGVMIALFGVQLAAALGLGSAPPIAFLLTGAVLVLLPCGAGLVAATFHLGAHPRRPVVAQRLAQAHDDPAVRHRRAPPAHRGQAGNDGRLVQQPRVLPWAQRPVRAGLPAERRVFFADARHPQNLYSSPSAAAAG